MGRKRKAQGEPDGAGRPTAGHKREEQNMQELARSMELLKASRLNPSSASRWSSSVGSSVRTSRRNSPLVSAANSPKPEHLNLPSHPASRASSLRRGSAASRRLAQPPKAPCECYSCIHGDCVHAVDTDSGSDFDGSDSDHTNSDPGEETQETVYDSEFSYASDCSTRSVPRAANAAASRLTRGRTLRQVIEGVKDTRSTDGGERADNEGQAEGDAATQEAESIPRHINDPADTKAGGDAKAKASSVATRWKGEIRKMIGGAKAHIHIHEDVDLRRRLGLSRNCKTRQKIDPCTTLVEFDGSHPVLGVDRQGRFLYLYLPEWMPADIHEHYYAVAAHFILGRDLGDCERKKRQARQSSRKRRKTAGVAVQTPRNAVPSNPNLPELGDDNVDSVYRHLCEDTSCYCQNNKCGSFHCGIWCQQGHPKNPDRPLAPTANLACNPSIKGGQAVLDFNQRTTLLHRMINYVVACIEPWTAATLLTAMEKAKASNNFIASQLRDITTMFFGYAFMLNKQTQNHRDQNSAQLLLDVLATLGEYEGGALRLPELGVKAHYGPRTLFLLRGGLLKHGIEDFDGRHRICMAYFAHQSVLTNLDIRPFVPRKIVDTKKSRPVFRSDAVDKDTWQAIKDLAYNFNPEATAKDCISNLLVHVSLQPPVSQSAPK